MFDLEAELAKETAAFEARCADLRSKAQIYAVLPTDLTIQPKWIHTNGLYGVQGTLKFEKVEFSVDPQQNLVLLMDQLPALPLVLAQEPGLYGAILPDKLKDNYGEKINNWVSAGAYVLELKPIGIHGHTVVHTTLEWWTELNNAVFHVEVEVGRVYPVQYPSKGYKHVRYRLHYNPWDLCKRVQSIERRATLNGLKDITFYQPEAQTAVAFLELFKDSQRF